jgi:hypothetical protein
VTTRRRRVFTIDPFLVPLESRSRASQEEPDGYDHGSDFLYSGAYSLSAGFWVSQSENLTVSAMSRDGVGRGSMMYPKSNEEQCGSGGSPE